MATLLEGDQKALSYYHNPPLRLLLTTVVEGDQKASFSIATTPRCRGGRYSFHWIATLYPWYVPFIAECKARRYQVPFLKSLVWRDLGLNPGLPDHWRTLYSLGQLTSKKYRFWIYSSGPLHMDEQRQDDQLEPIYNSSVPI